MKRDCPDSNAIQEYLDSAPGSLEAADIEKHAAACPECGARLESLRAVHSVLGGIDPGPPPAELRAAILSAAAAARPAAPSWARIWAAAALIAASSVLFILMFPGVSGIAEPAGGGSAVSRAFGLLESAGDGIQSGLESIGGLFPDPRRLDLDVAGAVPFDTGALAAVLAVLLVVASGVNVAAFRKTRSAAASIRRSGDMPYEGDVK